MNTDTEFLLLCRKIHGLRIQNQLSQKEMAKILNISVSSLRKIGREQMPVRMGCSVLLQVHRAFCIKFSDMFKADD